jgi:hypothetical protein
MEIFRCPACGAAAFFSNLRCVCGADLVWDPDVRNFDADASFCANRQTAECNWRADGGAPLCRSCAMTRTVPDLAIGDNAALWRAAESAKRWVLANLMRWGWFAPGNPHAPPVFDLLGEQTAGGEASVTMGHLDGVVTINVAEADPSIREARRVELGERYRTMTGHFRHELGHYLFARLATDTRFLNGFRRLFGDERLDYGAAIARHHQGGPPTDWHERFLSPYASAHPHEDWAETLAHLLHLVDIADTAHAIGLRTDRLDAEGPRFDAYAQSEAEPLLTIAAGLGVAVNAVNRAMGLPDVYPFVLGPTAREKLAFALRVATSGARP